MHLLFSACSVNDGRDTNWYQNAIVMAVPSGVIVWTIRSVYETTCSLNMKNFPFDEQTCHIISSQMYQPSMVNLSLGQGNEMFLLDTVSSSYD